MAARVKQLEQVMAQMVSLIQPYLSSVPSEGTLSDTKAGDGRLPTSLNSEDLPFDLATSSGQPSVKEVVLEYLGYKKRELTQDYTSPTIVQDSNEIGKLAAILEAFKLHQDLEFAPLRLGKSKLPEHFRIKTAQREFVIGFLNASGATFTARIKNFNQLVVSHPKTKFTLLRDRRESKPTGAVGLTEIEKLNHSPNGQLLMMEPEDQVSFDLIYHLIIAVQERDLEVDLARALPILTDSLRDYWLIAALRGR